MKKIIVLGAGRVGAAMAIDLSKKHDVTSVDYSAEALSKLEQNKIKTVKTDLSVSENISKVIADFDIVISAVPGFMGYETLKTIIKSKKKCG